MEFIGNMYETTITRDEVIETAIEVFDIEADAILKLKDRIDENFTKAIDILYSSKGKVVVTGMGKSGHIGKKIAATLCSTGTPAVFLHPAESTHGDSGIITHNDVVIAISNSGETLELLNLLPLIKRFGIPLIGMTGGANSQLAEKADVVIDISVEKEACPLNKAPTASTTATLAMGDAIAICLLRKRGFTKEDFLMFHPSGALGKGILYKVDELMIKGDRLPVINQNIDFREAVKFISNMKLGCTLVVDDFNKLTGILTDGDIRRIILNHVSVDNLLVKDVMTKNPRTIKGSEFAASALQLMEKHSITSLAIVDTDNTPIGLIHIHDLLRAKVA